MIDIAITLLLVWTIVGGLFVAVGVALKLLERFLDDDRARARRRARALAAINDTPRRRW